MNNTLTIKLAQDIAQIISSRDVVLQVKQQIVTSQAEQVVLDFSKVEFISRSAAHEFILLSESLVDQHSVTFVDMNESVRTMLQTVRDHRVAPQKVEVPLLQAVDINAVFA